MDPVSGSFLRETKTEATLVDALAGLPADRGSTPLASTKLKAKEAIIT